MLPRLALLALLAAGLCGCTTVIKTANALSTDKIAARLGLPGRGFATDALFPDDESAPPMPPPAVAPRPVMAVAHPAEPCAGRTCSAEEGFCAARGYLPDTDGFRRCLDSVAEHAGRARP